MQWKLPGDISMFTRASEFYSVLKPTNVTTKSRDRSEKVNDWRKHSLCCLKRPTLRGLVNFVS
jgi:hypothetical protein